MLWQIGILLAWQLNFCQSIMDGEWPFDPGALVTVTSGKVMSAMIRDPFRVSFTRILLGNFDTSSLL